MENSRIEKIKVFLKDNPRDAFLNYALAIEYIALDETEKAITLFKNLLLDHPDYSATYYHYGKLELKNNRKEEAEKLFKTGVEVAQKNNELHSLAELRSALNELLYDDE